MSSFTAVFVDCSIINMTTDIWHQKTNCGLNYAGEDWQISDHETKKHIMYI